MAFDVIKRYDAVSKDMAQTQIRVLNDEVGRRTFPRMPNATYDHTLDFQDLLSEDNYDSTLRRNIMDAANGITSMLFPVGDNGFSLGPSRLRRQDLDRLGVTSIRELVEQDEVKRFYNECTEELVYHLRTGSNFLNVTGEALLEWWAFGTGGLRRSWSERHDRLHFRNMLVNTYAIVQDHEGEISETYLQLSYTPRQAAQEWGKDALPEAVAEKLENETDNSPEAYLMGVRRMEAYDSEEDRKAAKGRDWIVKVQHKKSSETVFTSGFHDNPFSFGRWATITGIPYGFSPVWLVLPEVRRLNRMQELADNLGLAALAPPITALAKYKGRINRGPLGVTYVDDMSEAPARTIDPGPDYKIALDRIQAAKDDIGAVMHMDFFRLFTGNDDPPETATVARLMDAERAGMVGTPYQRLTVEFFGPQVVSSWGTLYRQGMMPDPPESLILGRNEDTGQVDIPVPETRFENRLVSALKAVENVAFSEWMGMVGNVIAEVAPDVLRNNLDLTKVTRETFRTGVKNEQMLRPEHEVDELEREMAAAIEQQASLQNAQSAADVEKTLSVA